MLLAQQNTTQKGWPENHLGRKLLLRESDLVLVVAFAEVEVE